MTPEEYIKGQIANNAKEIRFWLLEPKWEAIPADLPLVEIERYIRDMITHLTETEIEKAIKDCSIYNYRAELYEISEDELNEIRAGCEDETSLVDWVVDYCASICSMETKCAYDLRLDKMYDDLATIYYQRESIAQNMIDKGDNDDLDLEALVCKIEDDCSANPTSIGTLKGYVNARQAIQTYWRYL